MNQIARGGDDPTPPEEGGTTRVPQTITYLLTPTSIRQGGPTRTSADVSVPRPRTYDDRTGRVFPDHLITPTSTKRRLGKSELHPSSCENCSRCAFAPSPLRTRPAPPRSAHVPAVRGQACPGQVHLVPALETSPTSAFAWE